MSPYYQDAAVEIFHGDCRELMVSLPVFDACIADPPYGQTSLPWDRWPTGWVAAVKSDALWCFGTLRLFLLRHAELDAAGWKLAQDVVWEKHNGSSMDNERFRRVHELVVMFYRGSWDALRKVVPTTPDATARTIRRKGRPAHWGEVGPGRYEVQDGGPRQMRSVLQVRSEHGTAENPTAKPVALLRPIIEYSVAAGGTVLDPFCGSGSTLVACKQSGRRAVGIDSREDQCEIAARRCSQELDLQPEGVA